MRLGQALDGVVVEAHALLGHGGEGVCRALGLPEQLRDVADEAADARRPFRRRLDAGARPKLLLQPLLHHRVCHHPHVQLGIEAPSHALDHHHGFLQEKQLGARLHVEDFGVLEELAQHLGHGDFVGRPVHDRLADGA